LGFGSGLGLGAIGARLGLSAARGGLGVALVGLTGFAGLTGFGTDLGAGFLIILGPSVFCCDPGLVVGYWGGVCPNADHILSETNFQSAN